MSFYSDASLVMIPSGYKTSKVYSAVPTSGDGDLVFSRSNDTATRVASNGLIEKVRTNLILYSEQFDNAVWTKADVNVTPNAGTAPDGTTTADLFVPNTNNAFHNISGVTSNTYSVTAGVEYSNSFYAKANGYRYIQHIWSSGLFSGVTYVNIDLQTGTITAGDSANTTVESVGNGWYRIKTVLHCTTSGSSYLQFGAIDSGTAARAYAFAANNTDGYLVWGGQSETGVTTDYIATTSAAVSVGPVANVPRLDYLGSSCPRLILEPQRSNLFLQSEAINNAAWNAARYTRTANQTASPSGYVDADQCTPTATTGTHEIFPATGISFSATAYTMSLFAKYDGYNISLGVAGNSANWTGCVFDLQNGIAKTPQSAGSQSVCTAKIEDYGSGWYRCSITFTPYTTPTFYPTFGAVNSANATLGAWGAQEFTADGTSGTYIWGAMLEAGSYVSSYIPSLGAAVTRGADAASKTGISSLIGQTEGTALLDFQFNGATESIIMDISASGLSPQNRIILYQPSGQIVQFIILDNSVAQVSIASSSYSIGQRLKVAIAYKENDFAFYINGVQIGTDNSGSVPATSRIDIGNRQDATFPATISVNQTLLFKTRLTNAQLAELTTI